MRVLISILTLSKKKTRPWIIELSFLFCVSFGVPLLLVNIFFIFFSHVWPFNKKKTKKLKNRRASYSVSRPRFKDVLFNIYTNKCFLIRLFLLDCIVMLYTNRERIQRLFTLDTYTIHWSIQNGISSCRTKTRKFSLCFF
jgi:hypothetical protein